MSQAITGMFKKTDVYARIAGMSVKDFTALMNKDANAAFITFLKGLKGNNDGMAAMVKNLNDLKMDGSRTTQILGALASNVETLEQQQVLANQAFADGTSIINEFNTKNNTAQAQYEKSLKIVQNIRVEIGQFFQPVIQNLTNMLASLAQSSAKNLQDEYEKVKVTKGEIENKTRAVESLGQAYNDLKSKTSLNSTEQDTLNQIIQKLARICPSAVTAYNNLGEALDVNIDKLKEAIQHQEKLNQLQGQKLASEAYDNLESDWKSLQKSIKNRADYAEQVERSKGKLGNEKTTSIDKRYAQEDLDLATAGYNKMDENVTTLNADIRQNIKLLVEQGERFSDIAKRTNIPITTVIDIAENVTSNSSSTVPDTKNSNGDGPDADPKEKGKWSIEKDAQFMKEKLALRAQLQSGELSSEQEYNDRLLTLEIASLERRIALNKEKGTDLQALQDDLADKRYKQKKSDEDRLSKLIAASLEGGKNPELQQDIDRENASYKKRLEDLGLFWKDRKDMTKEELAALENLERRHNENLRYIYIGETQRRFDANRQMAESSINALKTEHNNQLADAETFEQKKALVAQLYGDERAKRVRTENEALKLIRKKYTAEEDELARKELENLISIYQEMMTELEKVLANADVTGMTDADRDVLQQKIDDLKKQMGVFSFFPALIVAIAWAGIKQTSGKEYKDKNGNYVEPKFWQDFVPVWAGAFVMWAIMMIG